jgi:D-alanyl-lipoteichoic acid acyltransferase DltB (MBOAT superfamily)
MLLKYIYTLFIGILLALFVGLGIAAFYEAPKMPDYPPSLQYARPLSPDKYGTDEAKLQAEQIKYDKVSKDYQKVSNQYNRNVSIYTTVAAIIILVLSLTLVRNLLLISDGLLLGGVFTLMYSIIRGFDTQDNKFRFVMVTTGLVIALILGFLKFIKPYTQPRKHK